MAYDNPIPGYHTNNTINLRLWAAKPDREFDLEAFNTGDYVQVRPQPDQLLGAEKQHIYKIGILSPMSHLLLVLVVSQPVKEHAICSSLSHSAHWFCNCKGPPKQPNAALKLGSLVINGVCHWCASHTELAEYD